jgi:hypothetical protein
MAAAMLLIVAGLGLRGRRTLEEGGPYVVVRCNNVVLTWLVRDACFDRLEEEENGDEEEENSGVMVCCVGDQKEYEDENDSDEAERLPTANFRSADHRWIECIAQV